MIDAPIEAIGFIAGFIGLFAWLPQLRTTWKHELHEGVDLRTLCIIFIALLIWFIYGFLKEAWAVCFSNLCSGFIVYLIIYKVIKLRR